MYGLTVRWSLEGCDEQVAAVLRAYVTQESLPRFTGRAGLHEKVWQLAPGGFFAGVYLWDSHAAREQFAAEFAATPSRVSQIVGADPVALERWEVVAVAEGAAGMPAADSAGG